MKKLDSKHLINYNWRMRTAIRQYFEVRDIIELLKISKDQAYHWVKLKGLVKPEIEEGRGRGGRSKFSFKNLLQLLLIKELYDLKFDFYQIQHIMSLEAILYDPILGGPDVDWDRMEKLTTDIWESFSSNRPEFERDGYILVISKGRSVDRVIATNEKEFYKMLSDKSNKQQSPIEVISKPIIIIDLLEIIRFLEGKTGNKLDYYDGMIKAHNETKGY